MICPYCESPFTRIEPNTNYYTCHTCHLIFGHITGLGTSCPKCGSENIIIEGEHIRCLSDDCHFITCDGYEVLEDLGYTEVDSCDRRFQYQTGDPVQCSHCHPIGSIDPPPIVACAFVTTPDETVQFPQSVMFPTRDAADFFKQDMYDID